MSQFIRRHFLRNLFAVSASTLLFSGAHDKNGGFHTGLALKQVLPNSTLKIFENSAHFPDMEEPDRFAAEVKNFISK